MTSGNIYHSIPSPLPAELMQAIVISSTVKIERIVSQGHHSPADFWYDQAQSEWVLVLQGEAQLEFADGASVHLRKGDYIDIAAHVRHRVAWTSANEPTLWLAVFY